MQGNPKPMAPGAGESVASAHKVAGCALLSSNTQASPKAPKRPWQITDGRAGGADLRNKGTKVSARPVVESQPRGRCANPSPSTLCGVHDAPAATDSSVCLCASLPQATHCLRTSRPGLRSGEWPLQQGPDRPVP